MWDMILEWIFYIVQFFYNLCGDWGMAIIIVTVIFRLLVWPLMYKQAKSSYQMQKMQPLIQSVQERFADDPLRQNQEMQKLYADAKFNPLAGCLPMLIQMPIFIALFQVLRALGSRAEVHEYSFYNIVPNLVMTPGDAFAVNFGTFIPYLILMLIFSGATFVPMILQQRQSAGNPQQKQVTIMAVVMSVFMLWIGWGSPAGVLLFWGASSLIGIAQSQLALRHFKNVDKKHEEEIIDVQPVDIVVTRKEKKKRPTKKR